MKATTNVLQRTALLAAVFMTFVFATACDTVVSADDENEEPGLEVVSAEFNTSSTLIKVDFSAPLVESTVEPGAFRIVSAYDNGRGGRQSPQTVKYLGGSNNTVEMRLWGDNGLGNGDHSLIVTGVEDVEGRSNVVRYSFTHRVTIRTPKSFIVRKIVVKQFPSTDDVGNEWDALSDGADIRVSFQRHNATPMYVSQTYDNANPNTTYTFGDAASYDDPGVPFEADYDTAHLLNLIDNDLGGDETMVAADINFASLYRLNNATSDELEVSLRRPRFTAVLHGDWTY